MNDQGQSKPEATPGGASRSPGTDPTIRYSDAGIGDSSTPLLLNLGDVERRTPKRLGKYEVHGRIGSGGMGVVFKGFDPDLQRMVAIKVLQPHLAESEVARRRFQREARAAAAISHENVLTIHAVEEQDQVPFLVMEYVSGTSLKDYIVARGRLSSLEIIRLSAQIARGLAAAHAQGVVHRDVKPGNVMLHEGGTRVRLTDFGLARVTYDNSDLTSHDQTVGTPAYMSPEQVRGDVPDARSDLFGLGCVMYCMATGQSPFHGGNHAETVHRILDFRPPPLQQMNPLIPPVISDLVDHLLAKRPEDRYQSAEEVADILTHLVSVVNQAATGEVETALGREVAARPILSPSRGNQEREQRSSGRRTAAWGMGLAAVVLAAGAIAIWRNPAVESDISTAQSAASQPVAPRLPRLAEVIVDDGPDATCATLTEALERVAPSGLIRVRKGGVYEEAIDLSGLEGVTIRGEGGVTLRPVQATAESAVVMVRDCRDLLVEGLRLEATGKLGRTLSLTGELSGIVFEGCDFVHGGTSDLSLVSVRALERPGQKPVSFRRSHFQRGPGNGYCLSVDSREGTLIAVECEECRFRSPNSQVYLGPGCEHAILRRNLFLGGDTGLLLRFKPWKGSEQIDISNNTFSGARWWMSWMDSTPGPEAATGGTSARLANNLILGGVRTLGPDAQWEVMLSTWTIRSNYWERDQSTTATADRNGRLASMFQSLDVPNRTDEEAADFLRPAAGSPLAHEGIGGDLPRFIGAREPISSAAERP